MLKTWLAYAMVASSRKPLLPAHELEKRHQDPAKPFFNDSSYFFGRSAEGAAMVFRFGFRQNQPPEYWLKIKIPTFGTIQIQQLSGAYDQDFAYGNLKFTCLDIGKRWQLTYSGPVTCFGQQPVSAHASFSFIFEATKPLVDFSHSIEPWTMAKTLAAEPWTRDFFAKLQEIRQVHYEQVGRVQGVVNIGGQDYPLDMVSVRDHSFGVRRWNTWQRHVWLTGVLDDGEAFNLSMIRYSFMPQNDLKAGFLTRGDTFDPVQNSSPFDVFDPQNQAPPQFALDLAIGGQTRQTFRLEANVEDAFDFWMGDQAYFIREGIARFQLGNRQGLGIAEFGFNPQTYAVPPFHY
ncbi:MAG TPA: hypothetical protein DCM08_07080 [Microscillaceae bacterium]|jgi:hypothetical protein|nr:hypothetical protein [Microscillaceae bacterium]